jgi:hypothetical protein
MADSDDWYDKRFDPYVTAVGRIAGIWAQLEFIINDAIWELANVEAGAGACITSQIIQSSSRMRALISLVHYRGAKKDLLAELNQFSNHLEGLGRQRNRFIHDPAGLNQETGEISRVNVTADRRLDFSFHPVDYAKMASLHTDIKVAISRFRDLYNRILDEVPPWPKTQFERSPLGIRAARPARPGKRQ